ncbi:hypothetical protein ADK67_46510 [Saccharothrix sp. NRRL B-16348]|uniref:hypothetical protein n=1 Tax=Saccharothrix sp. NRRL B-16348 TaxID=1415542 RepID=UPI0006AD921D|nr:hypothetical protein [Saccharothrix sp. NRRL B-16348]KOX12687.1 hypothetical protein ADK67_46510 [Saccharothrix sp. NRRL B-16348]
MSGVAFVFGLCALSFAAGCVLTAVMLRREQPPEPVPEPVPAAPVPVFEPRFPPGDYATRPIHRNPVMGIPTALPAPDRPNPRPNLVVVPDPVPGTEKPARQDEVRRMHVVRTEPDTEPESKPEAEPERESEAAPVSGAAPKPEPKLEVELKPESEAEPMSEPESEAEPKPKSGAETEPVAPVAESAEASGPAAGSGDTGEAAEAGVEAAVIQVVAQPEPVRRAFEAARRESNR